MSNENVAARHDATHIQHQEHWDGFRAAGFRPIAMSVYGARSDPRYSSVWVKRPGPAFAGIHGATGAQYQAFFDGGAAQGFSPTILAATGPANNPVYVGVMEASPHGVSLTRSSLTSGRSDDSATIQYWLDHARRQNLIPRWFSVFGAPGDLRYTLVLDPNPERIRWTLTGIPLGDDFASYQQRFDAQSQQWAHPALVAVGPDGRHVSMFTDGDVAPWVARHEQTSAGYQQSIDALWPQGYFPKYVNAGGSPTQTRFDSLFVQREGRSPRTLTRRGQARTAFAAVDAIVETHMRDTGTRAMGLAVTRGGRLVHARGFTWAEAGYPVTEPTTTFRLASCSKPLTSIGVHRLVQDNRLALTERMLDITGWGPPPNGPGFADGVRSITVHHLLAHASGRTRSGGDDDFPSPEEVATAFWVPLPTVPGLPNPWRFPLRAVDIARTSLTEPLEFRPGTDQQYINIGYLMLGLVIAARAGVPYGDYMRQNVFGPLGLTRPHLIRSRRSQQPAGSARQHSNDLPVVPSVLSGPVFGDRALLPLAYGGEDYHLFQAFGGWAMSAVDYVKVLASLARADVSPVLNQASLDRMWTPSGFSASSSYLDGWDSFRDGGVRVFQHGGSMPGVRTRIVYRADGWGFALFGNSDDEVPDVYPTLKGLAASSWPTDDQFTAYGIPAF